ncbi:MAG: cation:proton antiporter [bacterium]
MEILPQLVLFIVLGIVAGVIAMKLKTPLLVGYIVAGACMAVFKKFSNDELNFINQFAEIGVALLLFTIGLEFSLDKLWSVRKYALYGGIAQIVLTIFFSRIIFPLFGFSGYEALFLGAVFSLSSTAVVVKVLDDIGEIETHASQITIGWLILQDIAVVLLILLLGNLAQTKVDFVALGESVLKSFILIALALLVGNRVIPRILKSIMHLGSKELLVVSAFGFCFLFAYLAEVVVGSYTLGAFLAGMMISESFLHHEIFNEIKPLQNIFAIFFFILIGTLFSFGYLIDNWFKILLVLIGVTVMKILIVLVINFVLRLHIRSAIEISINLSQVGEFAFLSAAIGFDQGWISADLHSLIISVTVLSLLFAPISIIKTDKIYERIREYFKIKFPQVYRKIFLSADDDIVPDLQLHNHIIICGYGRVGRYIALALRKMHFHFILIEFDSAIVEEAKAMKMNAIYGDATSEEILLQAGIETARAIVVALPKETEVVEVINKVEQLNPDIKMLVRRHFNHLGSDPQARYSVIEPEFEAALKIMETILPFLGKKDKKVISWLREQKKLLE